MTDILPAATVVLLVTTVAILLLLLRKVSRTSTSVLDSRLDVFEKVQERTERAVREEVALNRDELGKAVRAQRQELTDQLTSFARVTGERLDGIRGESATGGKQLREEVMGALNTLAGTITQSMGERGDLQQIQLEGFSTRLSSFAQASGERLDGVRSESAASAKQLREEVVATLSSISETMTKTLSEMGNVQKGQLDAFSGQLASFAKASGERLDGVRAESATAAKQLREEVVTTLNSISETMVNTLKDLAVAEKAQLEAFSGQIASLTKMSGEKLDGIRIEAVSAAKQLREEVIAALKGITEATTNTMGELANVQKA